MRPEVTLLLMLSVAARVGLALAALALIWFYGARLRRAFSFEKPIASALLLALSVASALFYFDNSIFKMKFFVNDYDVFHYYLGAKYSDEIGYFELYSSALAADLETHDGETTVPIVRRMDDYRYDDVDTVRADAARLKALFSPERWESYKRDVEYFHSNSFNEEHWGDMLKDKGYNASPVWTQFAGLFANRLEPSQPFQLAIMMSLDVLWLTAMFVCLGRAFGWPTGLLVLIFFSSTFMMMQGHIRGCFLRIDWLAMTVMSLCAVKTGRFGLAGALLGAAGMLRIFPFVFAFGLGAKAAWQLLQTRRIAPEYLRFLAALAVTPILLISLTLLDGGIEQWQQFARKITYHNAYVSDFGLATTKVGFKSIYVNTFFDVPVSENESLKMKAFDESQGVWWTIQAVILGLGFFAVRRLEDYRAFAFGFVPLFFLTKPAFYYYAMLIVPFLMFAPRLEVFWNRVGASLFFLSSIVTCTFILFWPLRLTFSYALAWVLLALCTYMMVAGLFLTPASDHGEASPAPATS